jgi:hypothetical protein
MTISKETLDALLNGAESAEGLLGDQGLMKEFEVQLMERMLGAEREPSDPRRPHVICQRNNRWKKLMWTRTVLCIR